MPFTSHRTKRYSESNVPCAVCTLHSKRHGAVLQYERNKRALLDGMVSIVLLLSINGLLATQYTIHQNKNCAAGASDTIHQPSALAHPIVSSGLHGVDQNHPCNALPLWYFKENTTQRYGKHKHQRSRPNGSHETMYLDWLACPQNYHRIYSTIIISMAGLVPLPIAPRFK